MRNEGQALLIPASYVGMRNPAFGSILVHAKYAEKHGRVFWSVFPPGTGRTRLGAFRHKGISVAYFYDVLSRRVRFKARVHSVLGGSESAGLRKFSKYMPKFRKEYSSSPQHRKEYWILVSRISEVANPVRLGKLSLSEDGSPVRRVRSYAIIKDPHLKVIKS